MKILKTSVTKIVLLLIVCSLITIELYKTFNGIELDQVFIDACIMIVSFITDRKVWNMIKLTV